MSEEVKSDDPSLTFTACNSILENEIQSWSDFGDLLRRENRILFRQMIEDIRSYSESAKTKGKVFSFESMCMVLVIRQQKMIKELLRMSL